MPRLAWKPCNSSIAVADRNTLVTVTSPLQPFTAHGRVMGVINATPDSFFAGSRAEDADAIAIGHQMLTAGAAMLDVGGESTRPGAHVVDHLSEERRVLPVLEALREPAAAAGAALSIDTRNASVARAAVAAGATIINDISASLDAVAAETGAGWVAMHMQGTPADMQHAPRYDDVVDDVLFFLESVAMRAHQRGVANIWIDPGIGFGKTYDHNIALLGALDRFVATGWPVLLGVSRKSFIGDRHARTDGLPVGERVPVDERLSGSVAMATWGFLQGVDSVRAHDVEETVCCAKVAAAAMAKQTKHGKPGPT